MERAVHRFAHVAQRADATFSLEIGSAWSLHLSSSMDSPLSYDDLATAVRRISEKTPAALIRRDAVSELHRRGILEERADRALVISELGKLVCRRVNEGERASELE
jgi:hypothetical protein